MSETETLTSPQGRRLAYHKTDGDGPGVVFLGGFKSDMEGTKAIHLEGWAKRTGRAFLRFDYSGHGQSSEAFTDGCIGDWAADAQAVIEELTDGPQILVGSSMGGWIALLMARAIPGPRRRHGHRRRRAGFHRGQHVGRFHRGTAGRVEGQGPPCPAQRL